MALRLVVEAATPGQAAGADALVVPVQAIRFELGDTALPETSLSAGSFIASSTSSAVEMACLELRRKLAQLAVADPRWLRSGDRQRALPRDQTSIRDLPITVDKLM